MSTEVVKRERASKKTQDEIEPTEESMLTDENNTTSKKKGKSNKKSLRQSLSEICKEVYNSEYREFLSRDAKAWFKLSLFYFIFYVCLAGFFILLLMLFFLTIDSKTPNYFYKESVMHYRGINPGLGFRPQVHKLTHTLKPKKIFFTCT